MSSSFPNVLTNSRGTPPLAMPERPSGAPPNMDKLVDKAFASGRMKQGLDEAGDGPPHIGKLNILSNFQSQEFSIGKDHHWGKTHKSAEKTWSKGPEGDDDPWKARSSTTTKPETQAAPSRDTQGTSGPPPSTDKGRSRKNDFQDKGLSTDLAYGDYTPDLGDSALPGAKIKGGEKQSGLEGMNVWGHNGNGGNAQGVVGTWSKKQHLVGQGATFEGGAGTRGEFAHALKTPVGEMKVKTNGMAGTEGSVGGKVSVGADGLSAHTGLEGRLGLFGEAGADYRIPVEFKVGGVPIDLSPSVGTAGRTFAGCEAGGGVKMGVGMARHPDTGKRIPEAHAEVKGTAFAGAKAEGDAKVGIGDSNLGVSGGALAGVGAEGKLGVGVRKNKKGRTVFKIEGKLGLALGIGASLGIKAEIDITPLVKLGEGIAHVVVKVAKGIGKAGKKVVEGIKDAGEAVIDGIKSVGKKIGKGLKKAGNKVKNFFQKLFK